MDDHTGTVEETKDFGEGPEALVKRWMAEIKIAEKAFTDGTNWYERGDKIIERYRNERETEEGPRRFNVLWANVELLRPALYARTPKVEAVRRFKDRDPVGRAAAVLVERAVGFTMDTQDFDGVMKAVVKDRLLPGRGVAWVRYVPTMEMVTPRIDLRRAEPNVLETVINPAAGEAFVDSDGNVHDDPQQDDDGFFVDGEEFEDVVDEQVAIDYLFWKDYLHNPARNESEIRWKAKRSYMTRDDLRERFTKTLGLAEVNLIPLDFTPKGIKDSEETLHADIFKKATVWEIWSKDNNRVYWVAKGYDKRVLDEQDPPLKLHGFFPTPPALYATMTTDTLVPIPDFIEYQDQAEELDDLTSRIDLLTDAVKVVGVYNADIKADLQNMLNGDRNKIIPVESWAMWADKGGIKGQIEWLPIDQIVKALLVLFEVREKVKRELEELTGLSDILKGQTKASETLGAQKIKARFGTLRLQDSIDEVQRYARDLIRIVSEVVSEVFSDETIRDMAGMEMSTQEEVQQAKGIIEQAKQAAQQAQQQGQPFQLQPEQQKILSEAEDTAGDVPFEEALALLRDDGMRTFRIDIETDSTIAVDADRDKKERVEFLTAAGGFMQASIELAQAEPALTPLLGEMLMFGVRGFKTGRGLEEAFEDAMDEIRKKADRAKNQPPQPDPQLALNKQEQDRKDQELELKKAEATAGFGEGKRQHDDEMGLKDRAMTVEERGQQADLAEMAIAFEQGGFGPSAPG